MKSRLLVCGNKSPKAGGFLCFLEVAFGFGFVEEQTLNITNLPIHRRLPASLLGARRPQFICFKCESWARKPDSGP
jgi:hypothetical protein